MCFPEQNLITNDQYAASPAMVFPAADDNPNAPPLPGSRFPYFSCFHTYRKLIFKYPSFRTVLLFAGYRALFGNSRAFIRTFDKHLAAMIRW
jgi:hypothetical protein